MRIEISKKLKEIPAENDLGFGKVFTDHMLVMRYRDGKWDEIEIIPFGSLNLHPATSCLHYGQGIFEGAKAFLDESNNIRIFRIDENFSRMNNSARIMCMPEFDSNLVKKGLFKLLEIDKRWIPKSEGTALYIRPTMIAADETLGIHGCKNYIFFIILSPVGSYYKNGLKPVNIKVEENYVRASIGGTGEAKCMGNYAASLRASAVAEKQGFSQVLWLDCNEHKYVEEVGAMNIFFVIDDTVITPYLCGSILSGITRKSALRILKDNGYKVEERKISIDELIDAHNDGRLKEVFGTGTAAVISPVGNITYKGKNYEINNMQMGKITKFLYDIIVSIQQGKIEDKYNWVEII